MSMEKIAAEMRETMDYHVYADKKRKFAEEAVKALLHHIGDDPDREGLKETPARVIRAYDEMFGGYKVDVPSLFKTFDSGGYDEMIVLRDVEFTSWCEHHMLPFVGEATVAYIPDKGRIAGVSKLARVVDAFARRLQVQERLTQDVVTAIDTHLEPLGAACVIRARHLCMGCRGVRKGLATMVTSRLSGVFLEKPEARAEFLALAGAR